MGLAGRGRRVERRVLLGFVAFHAFLYSGATAFNSYYDRDVGPVGGLEHPPQVVPALLPFSLAVQAIGWVLAALVNLTFWMAYGVFVGLSLAYSHPRIRWKAHTWTSLLVVGFGQGALAFIAAWAATRGEIASAWSVEGALGASAAVLLILALYPLTQLYQIDEDAARGDRTVAVVWGPQRCFAFAITCTTLGGLTMLVVLARRYGRRRHLLVGSAWPSVGALVWLARSFDPGQILKIYRRVMRINTLSASALGGYCSSAWLAAQTAASTSAALMPPKPNALLTTTLGRVCIPAGPMRLSGLSASARLRLVVPGRCPRSIASAEMAVSIAPDAPSGWPYRPLVPLTGTRRVLAERALDGARLGAIADGRGAGVGVDIIDVGGSTPASAIASRIARAACSPFGSGASM